ncbi:MAG: recombinase RecJ [Halobacteriales archaeon]|nr:recombinase RecJ [Halobacteriales archaeon]
MQDWVIDDTTLPPERRSLLPGEGFFIPDTIEEARQDQAVRERAEDASVLVVADPDADGLACVAIIQEALGEGALIPAGPHELDEGLRRAVEFGDAGARVFVCDLCPDSEDERAVVDRLEALIDTGSEVRWFDHHQWEDDIAAAVRATGTDLVVGDSETECTADVAVRALDTDLPAYLEELAAVTRDHDLWIKEDERSDDLADYAVWSEPEEYIETVRDHGVEFPADVQEFLEDRRVLKRDLIERAIRRASYHEIGPITVGVTYGRCSQNEVAEAMREEGADASVIVKPAGSASIRGTDAFERCHEVARQVNGGGHPKAAGCKPRIYDDMLDYAHHWTTQGATARRLILEAFHDLEFETADLEDGEETDAV